MALPHIEISGNVQKIEQRQTQGGKAITTVSISCGDKKKDGTYDNFYIDATFWENSADFVAKNYHEGSAICVRGELITTHYEKDGRKIYKTEIRFPKAVFLPRDRQAQPQQQYQQPQYQQQATPQNNMDSQDRHNAGGYTNRPSPQQEYAHQQQTPTQNQQGAMPDMTEQEIPFKYLEVV